MKTKYIYPILFFFIFLSMVSYSSSGDSISAPSEPIPDDETVRNSILELNIPAGFDFKTSNGFPIMITDSDESAIYSVFRYEDDLESKTITHVDDAGETVSELTSIADEENYVILSTGIVRDGQLSLYVSTPSFTDKIILRRAFNNAYHYAVLNVPTDFENGINFQFDGTKNNLKSTSTFVEDLIWGINLSQVMFTVKPDGVASIFTQKDDPLAASANMAIDVKNNYLYTIGYPYPRVLYRYTLEGSDVIDSKIINADLGFGGPRLAYDN